jgi:hypothetical protein
MARIKAEWEKIGGGIFKFKGRKIRRGERFTAYEDEISKGIRDVVKMIGPVEKENPVENPFVRKVEPKAADTNPKATDKPSKFVIRKQGGWCNIYNVETNKKMNSSALRQKDAEEYLKGLEG